MDIFYNLQPDDQYCEEGARKLRCVGTAISHAVQLLESSCKNLPARIMTYLSGPCTYGPGAVVGLDKKEVIRTWTELKENDNKESKEV